LLFHKIRDRSLTALLCYAYFCFDGAQAFCSSSLCGACGGKVGALRAHVEEVDGRAKYQPQKKQSLGIFT